MVFTNVINPRSHVSRRDEFQQTLVRQGASLGANSTVVCGHVVGRFAFVGAGAVVTRDFRTSRSSSAIRVASRAGCAGVA